MTKRIKEILAVPWLVVAATVTAARAEAARKKKIRDK